MELTHQDGVARQLETLAARCRDEIAALRQQPEQGEPTVKDEIRFYTSQLRAFERALGYWLRGVRPVHTPGGAWLIPSGSHGGAVQHHCEKQGHLWICGPTCEAQAFHWHTALMTAMEAATAPLDQDGDGVFFAPMAETDDDPFLPDATCYPPDPEAPAPILRRSTLGARVAAAQARQGVPA